jgi:hypothetical protein
MEQEHDLRCCQACGHQFPGNETVCPFCGYRLQEKMEERPSDVSKPAVESAVSFTGKVRPSEDIIVKTKLPEKIKSNDQAIKPKARQKKWIIIAIVVLVLLLCSAAAGYMKYAELWIFAPAEKNIKVHVTPKGAQTYYFCYATGIIKGKFCAVFSNVIVRNPAEETDEEIGGEFVMGLQADLPNDFQNFKPIMFRKYPNFEPAEKERKRLKSSFTDKHYRVSEVNM